MPEEREERLDISTLVGKYVEGTLNDDEALLLAARMEHNERMVDFLLNNILSDQLLREKYKNVPLNDSTPLNMQGFGTDNSLTESTFFDSFDRQAHAADSVYFPPGTSEVAQHGHWFSFLFSRRVHHQRTSAPEIIKPRSLPKTDLFFILRVILFVSFITWLCVKEQYRSADYVSERFLPVGKVVGLADAVWAPETTFKWGQPFAAGKFKLLSGTAAIETGSGAKIVLEGPTELVVSGPMNSFCTQGKISISVPNAAHGFEVSTPQARLIDRGTEFFVRVQENESTVGVVAGLVDLQKENAPTQPITTRQAMNIHATGESKSVEFDSKQYLSQPQLQEVIAQSTARLKLERSKHDLEIDQRDGLLVHYRLDSKRESGTPNLAASQTVGQADIVGCQKAEGPLWNTTSLAFHDASDMLRFNVPGQFSSMTLCAAIRLNDLTNASHVLLGCDALYDTTGAFLWQIACDGSIQFFLRNAEGNRLSFHSNRVLSSRDLGTWVAVACVLDAKNRTVSHYLDGKLISRLPWSTLVPIQMGSTTLGNASKENSRRKSGNRALQGSIAEVQIYNRVLSLTEIQNTFILQ